MRATFRDEGLSAPNASDLPHVAVGEPLATRQELFLSNPPSRISGWKGCYRQLSAQPSNPSGLQEDYRSYDRRVRAFPASAGRQNRVHGSATTRFRRTGSILQGRFQFSGNGNGRLAGDCGLHQPVSQIWVPSSRPPVLSIIGVTPSVRTGGNTTTLGSREGRGLTTKCDANQLAA